MEQMNFWGMNSFYHFGTFGLLGIALLSLWSIFWKGSALWTAAMRKEPWWFVIILAINTAGILEIIYLFVVTKSGLPNFKEIFGKGASHSTEPEQKS